MGDPCGAGVSHISFEDIGANMLTMGLMSLNSFLLFTVLQRIYCGLALCRGLGCVGYAVIFFLMNCANPRGLGSVAVI